MDDYSYLGFFLLQESLKTISYLKKIFKNIILREDYLAFRCKKLNHPHF